MFTPIIGLEIHIQLKTKSKVFCSCSTNEAPPNTNICPICMGYPGAMPSLNQEAVRQSIKMGLALNCLIAKETNWDRKSYMYPDLFKGYQISQLDQPICGEGQVEITVRDRKNYYNGPKYNKTIGIFRAHLEEDTAKSIHGDDITKLDANKAGIPLLEIVSKPEMYTVDEAVSYAKLIRNLAIWYGISDCNMEIGNMRFDANISLCVEDIDLTGKKFEEWNGVKFTPIVEIKNLNSFGNLQSSLEYEIKRQRKIYEETKEVYKAGTKETRGWNELKSETYTQRKKEEANEYRYIPEPDIPTLIIDESEVCEIKDLMGKSIDDIYAELKSLTVPEQSIAMLLENIAEYQLFTSLTSDPKVDKVKVAKILTNELASEIAKVLESAEEFDKEEYLIGLKKIFLLLSTNKLNNNIFKEILKNHTPLTNDWDNLLAKFNSNEEIDIKSVLQKALEDNPAVVEQIKSGKDTAKMFFVGIVMRETKGKANPDEIKKLIDELI